MKKEYKFGIVFLLLLGMVGSVFASYPNSIESKEDIMNLTQHTIIRTVCLDSTLACNPSNPDANYTTIETPINPYQFKSALRSACYNLPNTNGVVRKSFVDYGTSFYCKVTRSSPSGTYYVFHGFAVRYLNFASSTVNLSPWQVSYNSPLGILAYPLPSWISG